MKKKTTELLIRGVNPEMAKLFRDFAKKNGMKHGGALAYLLRRELGMSPVQGEQQRKAPV